MKSTDEQRFVAVPLDGLRGDFEMCASGLVRRKGGRHPVDALIWLVPHVDGASGRAVYRLCVGDRCERYAVEDVFLFFGRTVDFDGKALSQMRDTVRYLNQRDSMMVRSHQERIRMHERRARARGQLCPEYRMKGCPWARGVIRGEAMGADPVLGF